MTPTCSMPLARSATIKCGDQLLEKIFPNPVNKIKVIIGLLRLFMKVVAKRLDYFISLFGSVYKLLV